MFADQDPLFDGYAPPVPHPAEFPANVLRLLDMITVRGDESDPALILDPMCGVGGVHTLGGAGSGRRTVGVEIEPEWASQHPDTIHGDARSLPWPDESFDAVVTSPPYGNRLADDITRWEKVSARRSYSGALRRAPDRLSAAGMQWGDEYRDTMKAILAECLRVLRRPNGQLVLNVKDHIRGGLVAGVTGWYFQVLARMGWSPRCVMGAEGTSGWKLGDTGKVRAGNELVIVFAEGEGLWMT